MGADFDSFIDEILELVGPVLIEEEIALPDFVEQFEQGVLFVKLHGSAKLYNGTFNALEKIKRTGNSSFARNENNDLDISTTVTIDKARIHYSQSIEFQGVRMNSETTTNVSDISIHFMVRQTVEDQQLDLRRFEIRNIGGIDIDFNGHNFGFLNGIISMLSSSIINLIKGLMKGPLEGLVKEQLKPVIRNVPTDTINSFLRSFSGY